MKNAPRTYGERRDNIAHADLPVRIRGARSHNYLPSYQDEKPNKKRPRTDKYKNRDSR